MNSDMVKSEKFGHLHLVYHFTVPLMENFILCAVSGKHVRQVVIVTLVFPFLLFDDERKRVENSS